MYNEVVNNSLLTDITRKFRCWYYLRISSGLYQIVENERWMGCFKVFVWSVHPLELPLLVVVVYSLVIFTCFCISSGFLNELRGVALMCRFSCLVFRQCDLSRIWTGFVFSAVHVSLIVVSEFHFSPSVYIHPVKHSPFAGWSTWLQPLLIIPPESTPRFGPNYLNDHW